MQAGMHANHYCDYLLEIQIQISNSVFLPSYSKYAPFPPCHIELTTDDTQVKPRYYFQSRYASSISTFAAIL